MDFSPQARILTLGDSFYDRVAAADFPATILRFRNDRAAAEVGLEGFSDDTWIAHFGRFRPFAASLPEPLALRYHGHQFRHYNPDIGDGRGFTFAQMRDASGRLMDFGTKGSGPTPWSRSGDGRLTLKGGVREVLATEMLEALGVDTSRSFSLIETGEALHRGDEPSPTRSAVLVRLSHGHIRIGSFQRLATLQDDAGLETLTCYTLSELYGEEPGDTPVLQLYAHVVARTAKLAASYMGASFVHGVLNSDNINVTGESFDYGPWRWTPKWDPNFTAAYFDHQGLYAFGRQAQAIHWDAAQLAIALLSAIVSMSTRWRRTARSLPRALRGGVRRGNAQDGSASCPRGEADGPGAGPASRCVTRSLQQDSVTIDRAFFDWRGGSTAQADRPRLWPSRRSAPFVDAIAA